MTGMPTSTRIFLHTGLASSSAKTCCWGYPKAITKFSWKKALQNKICVNTHLPAVKKSVSFIEMIFTTISGDFQLWSSSIASALHFCLLDAGNDARQITIKIQSPLIQAAYGDNNFTPHFPPIDWWSRNLSGLLLRNRPNRFLLLTRVTRATVKSARSLFSFFFSQLVR